MNIKKVLYLEVPTPDTHKVCTWLQHQFAPQAGQKIITPDGIRLLFLPTASTIPTSHFPEMSEVSELSIFTWSLQRTTYIKAYTIGPAISQLPSILSQLTTELRQVFPYQYPQLPEINLSEKTIFQALEPHYPLTVKYFQKMPKGAYDLQRVYWWEKRWREGVKQPETPTPVIFGQNNSSPASIVKPDYDLIYIGGALGVVHAAVMARLGYRVLLLERLIFSRMNREWNISRDELQSLIDLGLFTPDEVNSFISREYLDGFSKFFDSNNPSIAQAQVLHTPTVLNVALNSEKFLALCGEKLQAAGGEIWEETEFTKAEVGTNNVTINACHLPSQTVKVATGRLLVDAMGSASPIAWQLNGARNFNSVCPTVGAIIEGLAPEVWDIKYGDVLYSHGDISRGRQLIWELFPGEGNEITIYLFHYHQVHPENPGSLLDMYEDFFTILPEYRRCDLDQLAWKKPTFGYIPGHFSTNDRDKKVAFDRLISIGDSASLQSPLVFTGFGSLVRNLRRLTQLLDVALKHDLLTSQNLDLIRAYQSNISVTWLFSKAMMVPTGRYLPPERINSILNIFFGILAEAPPPVADTFIKDRTSWLMFNQLALTAAMKYPFFLLWVLDFITLVDVVRWIGSYLSFTWLSFLSFICQWLPSFSLRIQPWLESKFPRFWLWLLAFCYSITEGVGKRWSGVKN